MAGTMEESCVLACFPCLTLVAILYNPSPPAFRVGSIHSLGSTYIQWMEFQSTDVRSPDQLKFCLKQSSQPVIRSLVITIWLVVQFIHQTRIFQSLLLASCFQKEHKDKCHTSYYIYIQSKQSNMVVNLLIVDTYLSSEQKNEALGFLI